MHIVCPHCTTSYAVNPASFGEAGRTVRCARCKETWLATAEDLSAPKIQQPAMAEAGGPGQDDLSGWGNLTPDDDDRGTPEVESPSIAAGFPAAANGDPTVHNGEWSSLAQQDVEVPTSAARRSLLQRLFRQTPKAAKVGKRKAAPAPRKWRVNLTTACAAMGALIAALMIWRMDVVRLLPQTASFYTAVGLKVNLRGLAFKDVKLSTETVDGKPVLVIEGNIVGESRKIVELPRLRFVVRDDHGTEIYAWNSVLEQPVLKPGEKAWFRSRLASPPPEGRNIDVRFFNKRDIAAGGA